jgi:hypothetical protein
VSVMWKEVWHAVFATCLRSKFFNRVGYSGTLGPFEALA